MALINQGKWKTHEYGETRKEWKATTEEEVLQEQSGCFTLAKGGIVPGGYNRARASVPREMTLKGNLGHLKTSGLGIQEPHPNLSCALGAAR